VTSTSTKPLWTPSPDRAARTAMAAFMAEASAHVGRPFTRYRELHRWSIEDPGTFWSFLLASSDIALSTPAARVLSNDPMPRTRWFEGATLNYAQALLHSPAWASDEALAIVAVDESGRERSLTLRALRREVAQTIGALRRDGIGAGDRVAAFVSNVPEAVVLLLACAALGATFSSCSPDFGIDAAYARFHQIAPKLLVASDGYTYNGKRFDTMPVVEALAARLPGEPGLVLVSGGDTVARAGRVYWEDWLDRSSSTPTFVALPFDHPLYVLYSSGTTGLPKAMVHRAGGALLTHHKEERLHSDIGPGDRVLYFTTCGWMMWNWLVSVLLQGAAIVLFEGSPSHPSLDALWRLVDRLGITHFGTSARFLHACKAADLEPRRLGDYPMLRTLLSTGSPLSASAFEWVYRDVAADLHLASISGGTDIVGCFMLGVPTEPVYAGQIQAAGLGVDLAALDAEGRPVVGEPGELVCRRPLPSMPLRFWSDPDGSRYHDAYFAVYDGVWRHGDMIEITPQDGIVVYGRSDATLNPGGVRIGTAEIYRPLESIPAIVDALAVGRREGDDEVIWLFVVLQPGVVLDTALERQIAQVIRSNESPRHVPRRIFAVSQLPRTRSGKTMEIAVARLVNGQPVPNREVVANPESLDEIAAATTADPR
jgi:acetoacetyl-CoA synthetase